MTAKHRSALLALLVAAALALSACGSQEKTPLRVFYAGSLIGPFGQMEAAYEAKHPSVDLQLEGHGSIQVIRHVTELHEPIDVVVTADHALIPALMYETTAPETGKPYANWYIKFATNQLGLGYTEKSKYAGEINAGNWFQIIARPDVRVGIADPRFDASGYRALMALQLSKAAYGKPTVFEDVIMGQFQTAITARQEGSQTVIHVPEIVEPKADSNIVIRGASIQLIALLESGDLDYAFEYDSVIKQHKLKIVELPDAVNLGSDKFLAQYAQVRVRLDFQRFATVKPDFVGDLIGYGVTIPSNAPHPDEAAKFVAYLLGSEGRAVLTANQHPLLTPALGNHYSSIPKSLQALCVAMP